MPSGSPKKANFPSKRSKIHGQHNFGTWTTIHEVENLNTLDATSFSERANALRGTMLAKF
jgi:hypothetical protein